MERTKCSCPAKRFLVHVQLLSRMRDAAHSKMRVDQLKLIQLGNLLNASFESEELREHSDLEVAKMIVNWWKALVESDVASIERDVKAENVAILRCWNAVVEDELSKLNEEVRSNLKEVPTVPFKDKIEELESVLQSISSMRSRPSSRLGPQAP
jgi:anaerobic glycerol-3-phosphate dehydrogenase